MTILHINSYFSTTRLYNEMYRYQTKSEIPYHVYVPISYQYPDEKLQIEMENNITISRCFNQWDRIIFISKHRKILKDLLKRYIPNKYQLIHAHSLFSNGWLAYQLYKTYGTPYIVAVRSMEVSTFFEKMPWMRKTGIDILKNASKIIYLSSNTMNHVTSKYVPNKYQQALLDKSLVIPNGIHEYWHQNRYLQKLPIIHNPLRIIAVGRLKSYKRLVPLAEMTQLYHENYRPIELHIVGPNDQEKIAKTLETFDHVIYHGAKSKDEILQLYREMDIFALLSSPETFGLVYAEAMTQGLPLIYTKDEGFDGYFDDKYVGVSVGKNDYIGLNQAIDYIYANYETLSQNALKESVQFNWDEITQIYASIYDSIMNGRD
ncbi:glycosyltransferase family 4 protein [Aerococcaceae bacterium DSM 111020]|nr:glycosyltransferase family 4 protein [Aerococcaceae bacterium DSM 111020]